EGSDRAPTRGLTAAVADALARELVTPLGRIIDEERNNILRAEPEAAGPVCQTFGAYRYSVPRRTVIDQVGRGLTRRLVQNWLGADRAAMPRAIKQHLAVEWNRLELQPEMLLAGLASACECAAGESPEATFDAILDRTLGTGAEAEATAARSALGQLE